MPNPLYCIPVIVKFTVMKHVSAQCHDGLSRVKRLTCKPVKALREKHVPAWYFVMVIKCMVCYGREKEGEEVGGGRENEWFFSH